MLNIDRIDREFVRSILTEKTTDHRELASAPDFEEEPVPFEVFLRDSKYLALPKLSEIQLEMALHAERIYYEETFDALGWPKRRQVNQIPLAWGKGSGKDYISRILLSRAAYLLLCLAAPQAYYGMPGSETIHMTNIATSAYQAKFVFFESWVEMLKASRWFRDQMEPGANLIRFDKQVLAQSGHSQSESQEGQNLIYAVLDEWAGFKTAQELAVKKRLMEREPIQSAQGIYKTILSSITSRFPEVGKLIAISFTRFRNDPIDAKVKEAMADLEVRGDVSRYYPSRAATWDVNPLRKRSDFDEAYENDPADAQCRYECKPLASPHRYFQNLLAVRRALGIPLKGEVEAMAPVQPLNIEYYYGNDPDNEGAVPGWQVRFDVSDLEKHNNLCAIHFDLGISHDLAGMAMSHVEGWRNVEHKLVDPDTGVESFVEVRRPIIVTDFVVAFEQQVGNAAADVEGSDIQIRWLRSLIFLLRNEGWRIRFVSGDGYQSTDMFQLLEQRGVDTELYSLDRQTEGYDILKNAIYSGDVTAPFHPLLYQEIESLVKISERKIDHQAGSSKDMADAWAGSVRGALKVLELDGGGPETEVWAGGSIEQVQQLHRLSRMASGGHDGMSGTVTNGDDDFFTGGGVPWRN